MEPKRVFGEVEGLSVRGQHLGTREKPNQHTTSDHGLPETTITTKMIRHTPKEHDVPMFLFFFFSIYI